MTSKRWVSVGVDVVGYWVSALIVTQLMDHGMAVARWRLTSTDILKWLVWAIVMTGIMAIVRHWRQS